MTDTDTIAAISTPLGEGGIGIVRLSGPAAIKIAEQLFVSPKGRTLEKVKTHRVLYGFIRDPENSEKVDEVLLTVMRSPHTYTREDVVEINCHGGLLPLRRVLELTLRHGARLAEPGEFTKRAFLNGRIDLSQAEAVLDVIRAKTEESEKLALEQLKGALSEKINNLRDRLLNICAHIEAYIDFPEEEIEPASMQEIKTGIEDLVNEISALCRSYDEGRFFREGLKAVIAGRPNVGKSSLLNALLKRDRAIVTEMPGTTRDVLEEYININGLPLRIMDTAGIRQAHDMAEEEGVRRSLQAIEEADIVLGVIDGSVPLRDGDMSLVERLKEKNSILVINKIDLLQADLSLSDALPVFRVSAKTGEGLDALKDAIFNRCVHRDRTEGVMVTNLRHKLALDAAERGLKAALGSLEGEPLEITAMELREALDRLGEIVGTVTTEDILNKIFNDFCIGK
jgi:tRNA modification GTPase